MWTPSAPRINGEKIMIASVILAHPYDKSFNHAIFNRIIDTLKKYKIKAYSHDLYKEDFNPVLSKKELGKEQTEDKLVHQYAEEMLESKLLIFIHPNWWGQPPAMMKGYIDRVFRPPYAYDFDVNNEGGPGIPKLNGKIGIVFNTGNTDEQRENEYFHDPLENEWKQCLFGFCGINTYKRKLFRILANSSEEQRKEWLKEVEEVIEMYIK
jgi:NAD(P)H dehydrogenase (quinone)